VAKEAEVDVVALPNNEPVYELADTFPCTVRLLDNVALPSAVTSNTFFV
jgi:hypothetical protein